MIFFDMLKSSVQWSWAHKRAAGEIALAALFAFVCWRYSLERKELQKSAAEAQGLAAGLAQEIKISENQIEILKRDANGKVTYRDIYHPPEGSVIIDQKEKDALDKQISDLTDKLKQAIAKGDSKSADAIKKEIGNVDPGLSIKIVDHGFVFKPGFGADWANQGIKPRLDFKWYFYNRFSLIAGGGPNGMGPGISRHIDDLVFGKPENVEIFAQYNVVKFYPGDALWTVGFRSNF